MDGFWKAAVMVLIVVILGLSLGKQEFTILITMAASCMIAVLAISYFEPVLDLLRELESIGQLQNGMLAVVLKAVGIALTSELVGMLCRDAGNTSLAKSIQMLGNAVILYLSIPVFQVLIALIRDILGEL